MWISDDHMFAASRTARVRAGEVVRPQFTGWVQSASVVFLLSKQ